MRKYRIIEVVAIVVALASTVIGSVSSANEGATGEMPTARNTAIELPQTTHVMSDSEKYDRDFLAEASVLFSENPAGRYGTATHIARGAGFFAAFDDDVLRVSSSSERGGQQLQLRRLGQLEGVDSRIRLENVLESKTHFIFAKDGARTSGSIANAAGLRLSDVYRNIDVVYYGYDGSLRYDYIVKPGGRPSDISVQVETAEFIRLDSEGTLEILQKDGTLFTQSAPEIYQTLDGERLAVSGRFDITTANTYSFDIDAYDETVPLVIDPVIEFSRFLGGTAVEAVNAVDVFPDGSVVVVGTTASSDFAGSPGTPVGSRDVFVSRFSAMGTLLWSTLVGGTEIDVATDVSVRPGGGVAVGGTTDSLDFPTTSNAIAEQPVTTSGSDNGFLFTLDSSGSVLQYSTFLSSSAEDKVSAVAVNGDNRIWVGGYTKGTGFPSTASGFSPVSSGNTDGFLLRIEPDGTLGYGTFMGTGGSTKRTLINDIDIDPFTGSVWAVGSSDSDSIPTTANAWRFDPVNDDALVLKLNQAGALQYMSFYGGLNDDWASGVAVAQDGSVRFSGESRSADMPIPSNSLGYPLHPALNEIVPYYLSIQSNGTIADGSFLSNSSDYKFTRVSGIDVAYDGSTWLSGLTIDGNFPISNASGFQTYNGGVRDGFAMRFDTSGSVAFSGFIGGSSTDEIFDLATGAGGDVWLVGETRSQNFPVVGNTVAYGNPNSSNGIFMRLQQTAPTVTPPATSLIAPSGSGSASAPIFVWNPVEGATWYNLWVEDEQGIKLQSWYTAESLGCSVGRALCTALPDVALGGASIFWVMTWNAAGYGPWSSALNFVPLIDVPPPTVQVSPNGSNATTVPDFVWAAKKNATWYYLWVDGGGGEQIRQWVKASEVGCASGVGECSMTSPIALSGTSSWWTRTWNSNGFGGWSSGLSFSP